MKKTLLTVLTTVLLTVLFVQSGNAQVTVSGSNGCNTTYTSLTKTGGAFLALNSVSQVGYTITISITADVTTEDGTNALTGAAGMWTSLTIAPSGNRIISGGVAKPLIDLSGADYVTINGVGLTGANTLTISNTNVSGATIRFINDASNNTVKYCTIKGSYFSNAPVSGILFFSTTTGTTGNDNNTIDHNNITHEGSNLINCAIFSLGTASKENSGNIISYNNIYDFLETTKASSYGIYLNDYNTQWEITGNSFYQSSATFTGGIGHYPIYITKTNFAGTGYVIKDNYIGGSAPLCGGTWTKNDGSYMAFTGIYLNAGTGTVSSIQNNTIKNISYTNNWYNVSMYGIRVVAGDVNVGTITGNQIGESTGNNSITHTISVTGGNYLYGISLESTGSLNCQNNIIGSLTTSHTLNTGDGRIYSIRNIGAGSITNISNNRIGSTDAGTTNSIYASSLSSGSNQYVYGIFSSASGNVTVDGNVISKLTNGTTNASSTGITRGIDLNTSGIFTVTNNTVSNVTSGGGGTTPLAGIYVNNANAGHTISGNTVYNLTNSYSSYAGFIYGIYNSGIATVATEISRNFIHSLSATGLSSNASIYGLSSYGSYNASNNIISLGGNTASTLYGIYDPGSGTSNTANIYFNTVYIGGTLVSGVINKSYALYNAANSSSRDYKNNIFVNTRSTTGGTSLHYSLYILTANGIITNNYNDYIASGTGGKLGYYGGDKAILPIVTSQDANSLNTNPSFTTAGGTTPGSYQAGTSLTGVTGTLITTDYFNRNRTGPQMGAFESGVYNYTWTGTTNTNWSTTTNWVGGYVPSTGDNVVIQTGAANMPVTGSDVSYNTLEVQSGTTVTLGSNISLSGTLTLSGLLVLGNYNLTLGSASVISGTPSATNMIVATGTGELRKTFTGTGSFTFPVGDNTGTAEYSPVTLNFTSGTFASAYAGVNLVNSKYGSNSSLSHYLNRYWTVTPSGISSFSCNVTLQYVPADVVGTEANIWCGKYSSGTWTGLNQTDAVNHRLTGTVSGFSTFTGGENGAMPVTLSSFTSSVSSRDVKLSWVTASEVNNAGFFIEKSEIRIQNSEWKNVGFVAGKGTTNTQTSYTFSDTKLNSGKYQYRLKQIDNNGNFEYHNLNGAVEVGVPAKYEISQNYPNPFNPTTKIDFQLPTDGKVSLKIYDITGREMATLVNNEFKKADYYTVMFNGSNLSSGVYFYRITADKYVMTKKMVLLK
ncbi:MAG: T9SS type A sorting domain-containing protein [Ignavibacteriota bacterium]